MPAFNDLFEARFGEAPLTDDGSTPNPVIETQLSHRTHRVYQDRPVAPAVLQQILAATFSVPSKSDLQQATLIHVQDPARRTAIADLIPTMPWIADCAEFFVFCADGRRIQRIAGFRGKPFANENADNFLAAVCDAGLALQSFITAAESLGLGCCPISVIRDHMSAVTEILTLPPRVIPVAGMCLGYPAREGYVSMRLPLSVTCHTDHYDDSELEARIDRYDSTRDARFRLPTERQKYTRDFGVADFYGWSEDKARQMAKPERADVGDWLRAHGFSLD